MSTLDELSDTLKADYADLFIPANAEVTDPIITVIDEEKRTVRFYAHELVICEIQLNVKENDLFKSHIKFFYLHKENNEVIEAEIFGQMKEEKIEMTIPRILEKTASMIRETYNTYNTYFKEE